MFYQLLAGWTGHTEISREYAEDFALALDRAAIPRKAAAAVMGISVPQLTRQLNGTEGLNLWRAASLPWEFHIEFHKLRLRRIGAEVYLPGEVRDLLTAMTSWLGSRQKEVA